MMESILKVLASVTDVQRIVYAAGHSLRGLRAAIDHEAAFRQELVLFAVLAPLGGWLGRSGVERALLIGSLFVVLVAELLNSAVESTIDRIGTERHELSGRAKDLGSAAVYLAMIMVVTVWALVLADILRT